MDATGHMKSWYDRQRQSEPNPRRWLVTAALAEVVALITAALAVMAHAISHNTGPPWWSYLIFTVIAAAGVAQGIYRALRDRRRLNTLT